MKGNFSFGNEIEVVNMEKFHENAVKFLELLIKEK